MAFDPITSPQDYFELDNKRSPGIAFIENTKSVREWVERGGYGITGGFSIYKRRKLAHPVAKIQLYTPEDWAAWHEWKPMIMRLPRTRGGTTPASGYLRIAHPILEDLGITAVGVEEVSQPMQIGDGVWEITINFIEFHAPQISLAKPEATKPKPLDPYEEQIKAITGENQLLLDNLAKGR